MLEPLAAEAVGSDNRGYRAECCQAGDDQANFRGSHHLKSWGRRRTRPSASGVLAGHPDPIPVHRLVLAPMGMDDRVGFFRSEAPDGDWPSGEAPAGVPDLKAEGGGAFLGVAGERNAN